MEALFIFLFEVSLLLFMVGGFWYTDVRLLRKARKQEVESILETISKDRKPKD